MELQTQITRMDVVLARLAISLRPGFTLGLNVVIAFGVPGYLSQELLTGGVISVATFALLVLFVFCMLNVVGLAIVALELVLTKTAARGILGAHTLKVVDEGLIEETNFNHTVHPWHSVDRIVRFAGLTLVRAGAGWHLIPKRAISKSESGKAFVSALQQHMKRVP